MHYDALGGGLHIPTIQELLVSRTRRGAPVAAGAIAMRNGGRLPRCWTIHTGVPVGEYRLASASRQRIDDRDPDPPVLGDRVGRGMSSYLWTCLLKEHQRSSAGLGARWLTSTLLRPFGTGAAAGALRRYGEVGRAPFLHP